MFGKIESFCFVCYIIVTPFPKRMPSSYKLVHDEARCPHIHRLAITLPSCHLLRRLIDQRATSFVHTLASLVLDSKSKVHQLNLLELISIGKNHIAGLQVSVHHIMSMEVLQT